MEIRKINVNTDSIDTLQKKMHIEKYFYLIILIKDRTNFAGPHEDTGI